MSTREKGDVAKFVSYNLKKENLAFRRAVLLRSSPNSALFGIPKGFKYIVRHKLQTNLIPVYSRFTSPFEINMVSTRILVSQRTDVALFI
jgi:hypothetical protein